MISQLVEGAIILFFVVAVMSCAVGLYTAGSAIVRRAQRKRRP